MREFLDWMSKYNPQASLRDQLNVAGYERAQVLVEVLKKCGDDLTRANVMKQAASLDLELGMLRPGIRITTSASDYQPIKQLYLIKFDGKSWVPLGQVIGEAVGPPAKISTLSLICPLPEAVPIVRLRATPPFGRRTCPEFPKEGKLYPCTFWCGAGQSGNGEAPNCTRQDEKCLLSKQKPRGAWSSDKVKFSCVHPGFRMDTN